MNSFYVSWIIFIVRFLLLFHKDKEWKGVIRKTPLNQIKSILIINIPSSKPHVPLCHTLPWSTLHPTYSYSFIITIELILIRSAVCYDTNTNAILLDGSLSILAGSVTALWSDRVYIVTGKPQPWLPVTEKRLVSTCSTLLYFTLFCLILFYVIFLLILKTLLTIISWLLSLLYFDDNSDYASVFITLHSWKNKKWTFTSKSVRNWHQKTHGIRGTGSL